MFRDLTNDTKDLYQAMVLSEGEIESVEAVYVNEVPLTTTISLHDALEAQTDDRYTYTATNKIATDSELVKQINQRADLVSTDIKLGADNQDSSLLLSASPLYSDNHRGFKVAYIATKIGFDRDIFPSGVPHIMCDVKGKKVYDPRDETTAWSDNPALCLLDYLSNDIYGCKIPLDSIDLDTFKTEANYCDELVTVKDTSGTDRSQKRYTCNGVINTDDTCLNNMNKILTSMRGMLVFSAGKYKIKIDKLESATFEFTESNILGDWTITGGSKRMIANKVVARFFDSYNRFIETLAVVTNDSFIEEDNNYTHEQQLALHFVSQPQRANILAQMHLKQSRQAWGVSFKSNLTGMQVEVGDVVNITSSIAGWTQKPFRVASVEISSEDILTFQCSEYDDSVYTYDVLTPEVEPDTNLNAGFTPSEPVNFSVSSGTTHLLQTLEGSIITRAFLSWSTPVNGFVKSYEVGYKLSNQSDDFWTNFTTPVKEHYIQPVSDNTLYDFRVRALGNQGGAGDYVYALNQEIIGKTEPPSIVSGFSFETNRYYEQVFRWNEITDIDLDGYIIKYSTTTTTWDSMTVLHQGLLRTNPFETRLLPEGTYNFSIKAVDKSGNQSLTSTTIVGVVDDDPNIKIFLSEFPHLLGWTGTKQNGYVQNVELVATSSKDWDTFNTEASFGLGILPTIQARGNENLPNPFLNTTSMTIEYEMDGSTRTQVLMNQSTDSNVDNVAFKLEAFNYSGTSVGVKLTLGLADLEGEDATTNGQQSLSWIVRNNIFGVGNKKKVTVEYDPSDLNNNPTFTIDNSTVIEYDTASGLAPNSSSRTLQRIDPTDSAGNNDLAGRSVVATEKPITIGYSASDTSTSEDKYYHAELVSNNIIVFEYGFSEGTGTVLYDRNTSNSNGIITSGSWIGTDGASEHGVDWSDWTSWNRSPNTLTYLHTIDLTSSKKFKPTVTGVADGTLDIRINANDTGFKTISDFSSASNYVSSKTFVEGRYLTVYASVSGGQNILKSLSILLDGETIEEVELITDTPSNTSSNNTETFDYVTTTGFASITGVQVTSTMENVTAQVTAINQTTNTITIKYKKSSGTYGGDVSFYINVKGY